MTLEELERETAHVETLSAGQVAGVLGCDAQWLRDQARNGTFPLPFPYFFSGENGKKLVVPKRRFLQYMRGEDVERLHALIGELIDAVRTHPEVLEGWRYSVSGPVQRRKSEPGAACEAPDSATSGGGPSGGAPAQPADRTFAPQQPSRVKPAPIDWHKRDKPAPLRWPSRGGRA